MFINKPTIPMNLPLLTSSDEHNNHPIHLLRLKAKEHGSSAVGPEPSFSPTKPDVESDKE
jgi:hypothetical protein